MANPSGKPQNEQQVAQASIQQQAGESAKANAAKMAKEMREAKERAGVK